MYSCGMPKRATNASASRLCDSGSEAESAVIASAPSPSTRCAAHARYAESVPPEKATIARPIGRSASNSLSSFSRKPASLHRQILLPVAVPVLGLRNHRGRRHFVAFLQTHQTNTLRGAPRLPDLRRFDPDDLPVLAHNHQVRVFLHRKNRHHFAGL